MTRGIALSTDLREVFLYMAMNYSASQIARMTGKPRRSISEVISTITAQAASPPLRNIIVHPQTERLEMTRWRYVKYFATLLIFTSPAVSLDPRSGYSYDVAE